MQEVKCVEPLSTRRRPPGVPGIAKMPIFGWKMRTSQTTLLSCTSCPSPLMTRCRAYLHIACHFVACPTALRLCTSYNEARTASSTYLNNTPTDILYVRGANRLPHVKTGCKRSRRKCSRNVLILRLRHPQDVAGAAFGIMRPICSR